LVSCHDNNGVTQLSVQTHAWKVVCTSNSLIISATDFALLLLFDDEDVPPFAFAAAGDDFEALLLDGVFFIFEFLCVCVRVCVCVCTHMNHIPQWVIMKIWVTFLIIDKRGQYGPTIKQVTTFLLRRRRSKIRTLIRVGCRVVGGRRSWRSMSSASGRISRPLTPKEMAEEKERDRQLDPLQDLILDENLAKNQFPAVSYSTYLVFVSFI
jgi:hypothetical protein